MSAYSGYLEMPLSGERVSDDEAYLPRNVEGTNLYPVPVYDLTRLNALPVSDAPGLFRYRDLLPIGPGPVVSLNEGNTPLIELPRYGAEVGLNALYVKDESRNPTWSYKDRLAAVAVTKAVQQGRDTVVVSSTGNHGAAVAAYAARAGIRCVVLTLESVPQAMKTLMQSYGADVVAVKAPTDRWVLMDQVVRERGWVPMSGFVGPPSGSNPFGVEGYKSIAYEIAEQLGGRAPDVVVAPVAYGDGLAGLHRGFEELRTFGMIERVPRLIAAEPFGPFQHALANGFRADHTVPAGSSVAFSIATPMATWQGWNALVASGGAAAKADDDAIMRTQARLAATEGLFFEASSSVTAAILPELLERGEVRRNETVVLLGTSSGLKDVPTTAARQPVVPVIAPSLSALDEVLDRSAAETA